MPRYTFKRQDRGLPDPGFYVQRTLLDESGRQSAMLGCPGPCGGCASIDLHDILPDGTVNPSVHCITPLGDEQEPCGFHEFCRLEGWQP